jgi:hypothetical protein
MLSIVSLQLAVFVLLIFTHVTIHMKLNSIRERLDTLEYIIGKEVEQSFDLTDKEVK